MVKKFGIYLPTDLANELDRCMRLLGFRSKSRLFQEALRLFIAEHRWELTGNAVGIIGVVYDHSVKHADEQLTHVQHDFIDIIVSTMHVHLDKKKCMLIIAIRGNTARIKELIRKITEVRGVLVTRPVLLASET